MELHRARIFLWIFCLPSLLVGGQSDVGNCPATVSQCKCEQRFSRYFYIVCVNLQTNEMPPFSRVSNAREYSEVNIKSGSTVNSLQANAFANVKMISLVMQDNKLQSIDDNAFLGLENTLEQLHLDNNMLTSVPSALKRLKKLKYVAMPNNRITNIPNQAFNGLSNLNYLYMFGNRISFIADNAFSGIPQIKGISIHTNPIRSLSSRVFYQMTELRELELQNCNLTFVESSLFLDTSQLERLDLSGNQFTGLNANTFSRLGNLRYLSLDKNLLSNIQNGAFTGLRSLLYLYMSQNRLTTLNAGLFNSLTQLKTLYLFGNQIQFLPDRVFESLVKLKQLHLYKNLLTTVNPNAFYNLNEVWDLNLSNNNLQNLGTSPFINIPKLEYLDLQGNQLTFISSQNWAGNAFLKNLRLQQNRISSLDDNSFGTIASLRNLLLSENGINTISSRAFRGLARLNHLELQNNNLQELKVATFQSNNDLRTLKLSHNKLTSFDRTTWDGLGQLRHLHIDHNLITELPPDGLSKLFELLRLFGSHNKIRRVGERSFHTLRNLEMIDLSNNEIDWLEHYCVDFQKKLLELNLSHNKLQWIDRQAFVSLRSVENIDLTYNNFKTFRKDPFDNGDMKNLKRVSLLGNDIVCNCSITWMRGFLPLVSAEGNDKVLCSTQGSYPGNLALCFPSVGCPADGIEELNETRDLCEGPEPTNPTAPIPTTRPPTAAPTPDYDFPTVTGPFTCNFDSDLCSFRQIGDKGTIYFQKRGLSDKFDWTRQKGGSPSTGTGPSSDRSGTDTGYYMYIETSSPRQNGDKALLLLSLQLSQASCLKFYYHMFGSNIGTLKLLRLQGNSLNPLWSRGDANGMRHDFNQWYYGIVSLEAGSHLLFFEGTKANGYSGDIAIDDVTLTSGSCTVETGDPCPDRNCVNGQCSHSAIRDVCICNDPFTGTFCENGPNNPCSSDPCGNNAERCVQQGLAGYRCICKLGFSGERCQQQVCNPNPCFGGATCQPTGGTDFTCRCPPGFGGELCDVQDVCFQNPCKNNGECVAEPNNQFSCKCPAGFNGNDCSQKRDPCVSNPCKNDGTCAASGDRSIYECLCLPGYRGYNCEISTNPCNSSPCQNLGSCVNTGSNSFTCECLAGYRGSLCQFERDPCEPNPCVNAVSCQKTGVNQYRCNCNAGFTGQRCEQQINYCNSNPCLNAATCQPKGLAGYQCDCVPGWTGERCQVQVDYCESRPCLHGATCRNQGAGYVCTCTQDYTGDQCQIIRNLCLNKPCLNGAVCRWNPGDTDYFCQCPAEFTGKQCQTPVNPCDSRPCLNNGACIPSQGLQYSCQCTQEFRGQNCEIRINPCESAPCRNGATCIQGNGLQFSCNCAIGFLGRLCTDTPCTSNPCLNNGVCSVVGSTFQCQCPRGVTGTRCENVALGACSTQPCLNGGQCYNTNDAPGGFVCQCPGVNDRCQGVSKPCASNPCRNGARCFEDNTDYYCQCAAGFVGKACEQPVSACSSRPCLNNGICSETGSGFSCICSQGFTGRHCHIAVLPVPTFRTFRLVEGSSVSEGRLELFFNNQWGTICNDQFDSMAATVACKSMGYTGGVVYNGPKTANPAQPIWLGGVRCDYANYPSLEYCRYNQPGVHNCGHQQDVTIRCSGGVPTLAPTTPSPATIGPKRTLFNCDFDTNMCGMVQEQNDAFDFTRNTGGTPSGATGPSSDHSGQGYYIFIEASNPRVPGDKARIRLPNLGHTGTMCMTLWYHMNGVDMGTLAIIANVNNQEQTAFTISNDQGDVWIQKDVDLPALTQNVYIESTVGSSYQSDLAVDDITVSTGTCAGVAPTGLATPQPTGVPSAEIMNCDFERDFCPQYFVQSSNDNFDWTRRQGPTPSSGTGPPNDHTTGNGYYIYIEASDPRKLGEQAIIELRISSTTGDKCLSYWFNMNGRNIGQLLLQGRGAGSTNGFLKNHQGNMGPLWQRNEVTVQAGMDTVMFTGLMGSDYQGDIALDDIKLTLGPCAAVKVTSQRPVATTQSVTLPPRPTPPPGQKVLLCDFETPSSCNFVQSFNDKFNWTTSAQGSTPSGNTGPLNAHSGTNYAFIEASHPRVAGDNAILESIDVIRTPSTMCLKFWYHMFGPHINELNVYLKYGSTMQRIWSLGGDQKRRWYEGMRQFLPLSSQYKVVFEALRGEDYQGDIAIDDIELYSGPCWSFSQTQLCTFEEGLCFLSHSAVSNALWTRNKDYTKNSGTGPSRGANGTSYYLYIDSSEVQPGEVAVLDLPALPPGRYCLSFMYHMYGLGIGTLTVQQKQPQTVLFSRSGELGNNWLSHQTVVERLDGPLEISIQGTSSRPRNGDLAIDEVQIKPGACS